MISKKDRYMVILGRFIIILFLSVLIVGGVTRESIGAALEAERVSKLLEGASGLGGGFTGYWQVQCCRIISPGPSSKCS